MPTYEYKCDACGHAFEKFHSMSADPIKVCPVCGKESVRRLIGTGAGLIFKGSGFYITDYRDSGYKDSAKADGDKSKSADGGSGNKDGGKTGGDSAGSTPGGGESKPAAASADSSSKPAAKSESPTASKPAATPTPTPTSTPGDKK